mmetsp:Transcript_42838/g.111089  ORF Transcript_42838/g.111089 Transcript_42838/m.111089 type:complete len:566 (-) Transcript_42838:287-1984(-)
MEALQRAAESVSRFARSSRFSPLRSRELDPDADDVQLISRGGLPKHCEPVTTVNPTEDNADIDWYAEGGFSFRQLIHFVGPGFLMCIAYVDPGNLESDLQAGVRYGYSLLWVLLWATLAGLLIQVLTVRLALGTGMHLARVCRDEYPNPVRIGLWLITEAAIVCSDIPEVIGTAFALMLLFGTPLWVGVLITGVSTMLFLVLNARRLEIVIGVMVGVMSVCFVVEMVLAHESFGGILSGLLIPRVPDTGAAYIAVSLLGAVVMPHNLYLHSGSVLTRGATPPPGEGPARLALMYNTVESAISLLVSLFVNVAMVAVAAATVTKVDDTMKEALATEPLQNAPIMLRNVLGHAAEVVFALALLASGQSSTMTGTYAGQFVMEGFVELKMKPIYRALLTRSLAIAPSLACALIAGQAGSEQLIVLSSVVLSFQLPFALLPMVKFVGSPKIMGALVIGRGLKLAAWAISLLVIAANVLLVVLILGESGLISSSPAGVTAGFFFTVLTLGYLGCVTYLALRPVSQQLHGPVGAREAVPLSPLGKTHGSGVEMAVIRGDGEEAASPQTPAS